MIGFDLLGSTMRCDPHPTWDKLRETDPKHWNAPLGLLLLTRHRDVTEMLRADAWPASPLRATVARISARAGVSLPAVDRFLAATLFIDTGPGHPAGRRLVAAVLNSRPLSSLTPEIVRRTEALLHDGLDRGGFDMVADFADPLTFGVMAGLMGLDDADCAYVFPRARAVPVLLNFVPDFRAIIALDAGLAEAEALIAERLVERRAAPRDDGLSRIGALGGDQEPRQLAATILFMLFVGAATTAAFLSGAVVRMVRDDRVRTALADPGPAVDELLRLESTVRHGDPRVAGPDAMLGGEPVAEGSIVVPLYEAANRDPTTYPDPHAFRPGRPTPHIAFGHGAHACLGAAMARLEARIALAALAAAPAFTLRHEPMLEPLDALRRLAAVPVDFV